MVKTRRTKTDGLKKICGTALSLLAVGLLVWWIVPRDTYHPWLAWIFLAAALGLAFWALGEQFLFSFGKSRYPTRTERKRLRHQRKKNVGGETILGREISEQHDK